MLFITGATGNSKHKKNSCTQISVCWILCREYQKVTKCGDGERGERSKQFVTKSQTKSFQCSLSVGVQFRGDAVLI